MPVVTVEPDGYHVFIASGQAIPINPAPRYPSGSADRERTTVMPLQGVMRLGYVHARVTDLTEAKSHYGSTLGLYPTYEEPGKIYYKGWDEWDHHSVVLEEGGVGAGQDRLQGHRPDLHRGHRDQGPGLRLRDRADVEGRVARGQ